MRTSFCSTDCRDVLLPLVTDQLSGQLDDHSIKPDYEACAQLLSTVLDNLDRRDVVSRNPESKRSQPFLLFVPETTLMFVQKKKILHNLLSRFKTCSTIILDTLRKKVYQLKIYKTVQKSQKAKFKSYSHRIHIS